MPIRVCSFVGSDRRACGRITHHGNRCELHPKRKNRSGSYTRTAAKVRANAETCHLCGLPFTDPNDPPVADHVTPRMWGGADDETNLKAAHRSCNGQRGQAMQW